MLSIHTVLCAGHTFSTLVEHTLVVTRQIHPAIILTTNMVTTSLYRQVNFTWPAKGWNQPIRVENYTCL